MHADARRWRSWLLKLAVWAVLALFLGEPGAAEGNAAPAPEREQGKERRIALVIGNARYPSIPLTNPENDARVVATTLRRLGFEVNEHVNLPVKEFRRVLRDFARRVQSGSGASVFYYAGHGVQIGGRNFLLPVDINLRDQDEIRDEGIDIDELLLSRLERAQSQVRIVILDACRDNPFTPRQQSRSSRGSGGLAEMAARGALIAYATAPGAIAEDGPPGTNSVFTRHLAKEMLTENVEVEQMFKNVRVKVMRDTLQRQVPWVNTSMTTNFSFNPIRGPSREEQARREDLARLQQLLEQRDQQQKLLEQQLDQLNKRLATSTQSGPALPPRAQASAAVPAQAAASAQAAPGPAATVSAPQQPAQQQPEKKLANAQGGSVLQPPKNAASAAATAAAPAAPSVTAVDPAAAAQAQSQHLDKKLATAARDNNPARPSKTSASAPTPAQAVVATNPPPATTAASAPPASTATAAAPAAASSVAAPSSKSASSKPEDKAPSGASVSSAKASDRPSRASERVTPPAIGAPVKEAKTTQPSVVNKLENGPKPEPASAKLAKTKGPRHDRAEDEVSDTARVASSARPAPASAIVATRAAGAANKGGGSERCVALLIRAQLGEAIGPGEMSFLKKECH